ncbi:MAG TPA: pyruvate, phosphate dikinase [Caldisericia bacterium]|nr:pyruvate, phosphate dikinase [Caldisericia bacterium]HQL66406.1 pyruvate, phosphate dikinase [Caldisericia bacterium]HQN47877.1 pyruvate, phosphate dikinase [Caldisericia bacterium]HQO99275.1 pyruvate, phosphate dikinase [Caldisericia bacterium]
MASKRIYEFEEGSQEMKALLGGKGAGLAEMTKIGLPVPYGFTITTEVCNEYYKFGEKFPPSLEDEILEHLKKLEEKTKKIFGSSENPLLVSVRSGAPVSMPGMMDTILNLGLNDLTVEGLSKLTKDKRFAYDSYRRFITMFSNVVMGIEHKNFEEILEETKERFGVKSDAEIPFEGLKEIVDKFKQLYKKETGEDFPQDPYKQLMMAIEAVFKSWNNKRAIEYRRIYKIPEDLGTAVNIQMMVFGNAGYDSGTGVGFTRDPATGENKLYGEYLLNAQGEDVVAGIRTPKPIEELKNDIPSAYEELLRIKDILEKHYRDIQDFEFTIEKGKLFMLQTRTGQRTPIAAVKIAVDMFEEEVISKEEAVMRVNPYQVELLLHPMIDPKANVKVIARGLPASPGAAYGKVVFDTDEAALRGNNGDEILLVRPETTPEDIHGMVAAKGILTARGGMTSHAAVVARGMGKPCIVGCEEIKIDMNGEFFVSPDGTKISKDEYITIDGGTGRVILGKAPLIEPEISGNLEKLLKFADEIRKLGVRANANTPEDAKKAKKFGAEGIGLLRIERMFLDPERLPIVQDMIMAKTKEEREIHLKKIVPMIQKDFEEMIEVMDNLPVTIRLLDPPLHEFLPQRDRIEEEIKSLKENNGDIEEIKKRERILRRIKELYEHNPMIGWRGCRVGIVYPEIYEAMIEAIIMAGINLKRKGFNPVIEIMHPLVAHENELKILKDMTDKVAEEAMKREGIEIKYLVGTMIEVPRASICADKIAKYAEFFSFGTNDLTQTTYAFSRDDVEASFLPFYIDKKILPENPFMVLDIEGVGKLVEIGTKLGKESNSQLEVGICGEHGGEPASVKFFHKAGLDYVSCSPFRIPIAKLSAAQAVVEEKFAKKEAYSDSR